MFIDCICQNMVNRCIKSAGNIGWFVNKRNDFWKEKLKKSWISIEFEYLLKSIDLRLINMYIYNPLHSICCTMESHLNSCLFQIYYSKLSLNYLVSQAGIDSREKIFRGAELQLSEKFWFIKICSWFGRRLTFCHLFLLTSKYAEEIKAAIFLCKTISTYWYTTM